MMKLKKKGKNENKCNETPLRNDIYPNIHSIIYHTYIYTVYSSPDTESTCICCSAYKSSTCGKIFVRCLIIWQIITMLIIFALDVNKWFEWEDEQDLINDTNTWENYQCFSAIVITSSNYSTLVVNFGGMIAHPDWKNPFRLAWNICVCSLFAFYFLWMIMYGLAGTLLYCYLVLPIAGIMICMKFVCNCDGVSRRCYRQLIFPILLIFIVIILSLTCVNWFSGTLDYWISFELVLFERQYKVYFKHTLKSGEAVFRFFTAFLG